MKKNKILNILMVFLIFVMIGGAVMYAGSLKGWFDKKEEINNAVADPGVGVSSVVRNSIGFSVAEGTVLRDGDELTTSVMSTLSVSSSSFKMTLNGESHLSVASALEDGFDSDLLQGEAFLTLSEDEGFAFKAGDLDISLKKGVYHISAQTGAISVSVFSGEASYTLGQKVGLSDFGIRTSSSGISAKDAGSGKVYVAKAGEVLSIVQDEVQTVPLQATSLNEFTIENAKKAIESSDGKDELCFTAADLDKVVADREEEKRIALEELAKWEAEVKAKGGTEAVHNTVVIGGGSSGGSASNVYSCTIQILCYTILDNIDNLRPGKDAYVPANGVILATTRVNFNEGDTVFDVLNGVCKYAGIQIEYSWTPMYNSYYIEGINYLYEFDCGPESGWMYKVNGWFPNYGCSSYTLHDGDAIVWTYTCSGLGADVGGSVY